MKKFALLISGMIVSGIAYAAQPDEKIIESCSIIDSVKPSVTYRLIPSNKIVENDYYNEGSKKPYEIKNTIKHSNNGLGYTENKHGHFIIYKNKFYRLSDAISIGNNYGLKPDSSDKFLGAFNPNLSIWGIVKKDKQQYFCITFNFDGMGQTGSWENIVGGYLLDLQNKQLYFAVRDRRKYPEWNK